LALTANFSEGNMTAKEHNKLVGIFLLIHGGFSALMMIFMVFIYGVIGAGIAATAQRQEEQMVGGIFILLVVFISVFSVLLIVPQLIGGWKLLKERSNARTWGIIGSILALLSMPFGTAAGVYGLWFLFGEQGKQFYLGGNNYAAGSFPPPPQSWQ
jgi:glucan phosphoethanolaminetransferase (alkaline phosphatase superfamily)